MGRLLSSLAPLLPLADAVIFSHACDALCMLMRVMWPRVAAHKLTVFQALARAFVAHQPAKVRADIWKQQEVHVPGSRMVLLNVSLLYRDCRVYSPHISFVFQVPVNLMTSLTETQCRLCDACALLISICTHCEAQEDKLPVQVGCVDIALLSGCFRAHIPHVRMHLPSLLFQSHISI